MHGFSAPQGCPKVYAARGLESSAGEGFCPASPEWYRNLDECRLLEGEAGRSTRHGRRRIVALRIRAALMTSVTAMVPLTAVTRIVGLTRNELFQKADGASVGL
jgi:hypothetical protein